MPQIASKLSPTHMSLTHINPTGLYDPVPNGYSHVVVAPLRGRTIYASGQGGENLAGELSPDFAQQLEQALANMRTALTAAGATVNDVVRLTLLVVDHSEARLAIWADAARRTWTDGPAPGCTLIPVPRLALDGMLVEMEATAVVAAAPE